jgi:hypothetical protein
MENLTDDQKEKLKLYPEISLLHLRSIIGELSSDYAIRGLEIGLNEGKQSERTQKLQAMSNNLSFGCELIDFIYGKMKAQQVEINRKNKKIADLVLEVDRLNNETKRLNKLNENLKKNINL